MRVITRAQDFLRGPEVFHPSFMAKREAWLDEYTTSNPVTNPTRSTLLEGTWNCIPTRPLAPCPVQTMRFRDRDDTRMWVDDVYMLPLPGMLSRVVTLVRRYDASVVSSQRLLLRRRRIRWALGICGLKLPLILVPWANVAESWAKADPLELLFLDVDFRVSSYNGQLVTHVRRDTNQAIRDGFQSPLQVRQRVRMWRQQRRDARMAAKAPQRGRRKIAEGIGMLGELNALDNSQRVMDVDDEAMQRFLDDAGSMRSQFSVKDMLSGRITPINKTAQNATAGALGR